MVFDLQLAALPRFQKLLHSKNMCKFHRESLFTEKVVDISTASKLGLYGVETLSTLFSQAYYS